MSLSKDGLKQAIMDALDSAPDNKDDAMEALAGAIVDHIQNNLEVNIPSATIITTVSGGSGAPAVGIKNVDEITLEVS